MVKIKICGLKTLADVEKVNRYLPEYVGFVFAHTKRFVADEQALEMKRALDKRIKAVGVFVDEPVGHVVGLCRQGILDMVQLHGSEPDAYIRELKKETDTPVIKAIKVQTAGQVLNLMSEEADFMLFDTYKQGELGGTGERFSLGTLEESLRSMEAAGKRVKPYFLAGGLDSQNVAGIIAEIGGKEGFQAGCFAVDVSTGVETGGAKDETKISQFIESVRQMEI